MKWIGQHIVDLIARFRSDVYLDSPTAGGSDPDKFLGIDSNNKIIYRTGSEVLSDIGGGDGDITSVTAGNALTGGGTSGALTINHEDTSSQASVDNSGRTFIQDIELDTYGHVISISSATDSDTHSGDITGVTIQTDSGSGSKATDTAGSADFSILGAHGVGVTNSGTTITAVAVPGEIDHDSLLNFADNKHFLQSEITTVGTIGTGVWNGTDIVRVGTIGAGVWNGTAIASAYLDADTAHYSATRQVTHHMIKDDIGTGVIYISLGEIDAESGTKSNKNLPLLAPVAGKLLKVFLRTTQDMSASGHNTTLTWTLLTRAATATTTGNAVAIGVQSGAGPTASSMATYDFTSSLDDGVNTIVAGDKVQLSVQSDAASADSSFFISCLWEWDLS